MGWIVMFINGAETFFQRYGGGISSFKEQEHSLEDKCVATFVYRNRNFLGI